MALLVGTEGTEGTDTVGTTGEGATASGVEASEPEEALAAGEVDAELPECECWGLELVGLGELLWWL